MKKIALLVIIFILLLYNDFNLHVVSPTQQIVLSTQQVATIGVGVGSINTAYSYNLFSYSTVAPPVLKYPPKVSVNTDIQPQILKYLESVSENYELSLLQGIIQLECEGTWNPKFIDNQDYGLCQINVCNHGVLKPILINKYGYFDILDYRQNIDSMIFILDSFTDYLTYTLGREPSVSELLTAYNKGPYYAQKRGVYTPYVDLVLEYQEEYKIWNDWRRICD